MLPELNLMYISTIINPTAVFKATIVEICPSRLCRLPMTFEITFPAVVGKTIQENINDQKQHLQKCCTLCKKIYHCQSLMKGFSTYFV